MKKKLITMVMTGILAISAATIAYAGEWKQDTTGWWYQNDDGSYPTNNWETIDGKEYYFNEAGYMLANTTTPDGKQVGADGALVPAPIFNFTLDDCNITYTGYEISKDFDGQPCVIIYYNYTNLTSDPCSTYDSSSFVDAYQNGIECEPTYLTEDNQAYENYFRNVFPGATVNVAEIFRITDQSDISLLLEDYYDISDSKKTATAVLNLHS